MASLGAPVLPHMPDFSLSNDPFSTPDDMKSHLQHLLDSKEKQLQQAGLLGQRVLAQQADLDELMRQLQEMEAEMADADDDSIEHEARLRYNELADKILQWDRENAQLSSIFGVSSSKHHTNGNHHFDVPRDESERVKASGSSAAQSRRAKNAAHRADDVEFAFEIGSGLLTEVRRLQSLLGERDKAIQDMKEEKDDLEKSVEALRKGLREQEQSTDKFKEENWNLEVNLQELRKEHSDAQASVQRLESEQKRLTKSLASSRDAGDQHKNEAERLLSVIEELKSKHETDVAQARKHAAGLARDKSDLQQSVDTLKAEVARAARRLPRYTSPLTPGGQENKDFLTPGVGDDENDVFASGRPSTTRRNNVDMNSLFPPEDEFGVDDSPDPSPIRKPFHAANHPTNEIEALQQRLAHAQRQINTLKGTLAREKQLRMRLEDAKGGAQKHGDEDEEEEEDFNDENTAITADTSKRNLSKRTITPFKVGGRTSGRGRGRGGRTAGSGLIHKFGAAMGSPSSDYNDEDDHRERGSSPPPPVPAVPNNFNTEDDEVSQFFGSGRSLDQEALAAEHDEHQLRSRSPSPTPSPPHAGDGMHSNRTSVDGMDPAFANVLKRVPSNGSGYAGSPLRQSVLNRSARGRAGAGVVGTRRRQRGGAAFRDVRPASIVDAPEVLAAELSAFDGMQSMMSGGNSSLLHEDKIEEDEDDGVEYIRVKKVEKVEFGCQTEVFEEEKTVTLEEAPVVESSLVSAPVPEPEVIPAIVHVEMGVQSDPEPEPIPSPKIITADMAIQSDPEVTSQPEPVPPPPVVVTSNMGVQSEPEPAPVLPPAVVTSSFGLQTDPEPVVVVEKAEMGIQHYIHEPVVELPSKPILVDSGVGTDPLPEPETTEFMVGAIGLGLPSSIEAETGRRSTVTQASISQNSSFSSNTSSAGDSTITRSFLAAQPLLGEEDEFDEGEETETGAETETEDDYHDARQSIMTMTPTPTDDFHSMRTGEDDFQSVRTMSENGYSSEEGEDDTESIKASNHVASVHSRSTSSFEHVSSSSSSYYPPVGLPMRNVTYEDVGVGANLYEPPEPVYVEVRVEVPVEVLVEVPVEVLVEVPVEVLVEVPIEVPVRVEVPVPALKPEVAEISIQTDEWKPPASAVPVVAPVPKSIHTPGLYRVGSGNHQFQFVPPPASAASATSNGPPSATLPHGPVFTAPSPVPTPMSSVFRESSAHGTISRRHTASDRRQSIESLISSGTTEELSSRSRVPSASGPILASMDKSRPPVMSLPPPPKLPPPPNTMLPPNFIPERRLTSQGIPINDGPPPRPSSPPPPELIQRATTPLGSVLSVPGASRFSLRSQPSSAPPSQTGLRQPPSTGSFRSAAPGFAQVSMPPAHTLSSHSVRERGRSTTSFTSDHSVASPRSSMSSDHHMFLDRPNTSEAPSTPNKTADITPRANGIGAMPTDPAIIHAITQTMIGEFLYKYTRSTFGKGVGEKRHKRFFWVHPYTKTLYWSSADPGSSNVAESSAKSTYIEGVRSVLDPNPMPPGLYQYSVIISTPQREMKITALTKERHDIWLNALKYLLSRPNNPSVTSPANNLMLPPPKTPENNKSIQRIPLASPSSQRSSRSPNAGDAWNTTPRGTRSRSQLSVGRSGSKRSGTPALEYMRWNAPESPYSPDRSFVDVPDPADLDFELHDETMSDEGFEGLENVRACCDGRHTVGHSGKVHHHHHNHTHNHTHAQSNQGTLTSRRSTDNHHLDPNAQDHVRPSSPAWSFRSRTGSTQSHDRAAPGGAGGGGLFSWGRGDNGKLRFGSRRSTKSSVPTLD